MPDTSPTPVGPHAVIKKALDDWLTAMPAGAKSDTDAWAAGIIIALVHAGFEVVAK